MTQIPPASSAAPPEPIAAPPAPPMEAAPPVKLFPTMDLGTLGTLAVCVFIILHLLSRRRFSESTFQDQPPAPRFVAWWELGLIVGVYILVSLYKQETALLISLFIIAAISLLRSEKIGLKWVGDIGAPRLWGRLILITLGSIVLTLGVSILTTAIHGWVHGRLPDPVAHEALKQLIQADGEKRIVIIISAIIMAPIMEEIIFRGFLQRALAGLIGRQWPAITLTSLAFALVHIGPADMLALPMLFVLSLGMGYALAATGRLWAPMFVHAAFNASQIAIVLLGADGP